MWRCRSCETMNEDAERTCIICGEPRPLGGESAEGFVRPEVRASEREIPPRFAEPDRKREAEEVFERTEDRPLGEATAFPAPGARIPDKAPDGKSVERYLGEDEAKRDAGRSEPKGTGWKVLGWILLGLFLFVVLMAIVDP